MSRYAHITGWGTAIPERLMTNEELAQLVDTTDEWIVSRTGIRSRHIAGKQETTASLAAEAACRAIAPTNIEPHDLDLIIVSTSSPEHLFPATACLVQDEIGAVNAGAFDLSAACTGFIYALNMAAQAIRTGSIDNALVIGSETLSRLVNWEDRTTCILFGDGAGAFVLQGSERPGGIYTCVMRSDGSGGDLLSVPAGGSKLPASAKTVEQNLHTIQMNGREVFRFATRVMASATREVVESAGWTMDQVDRIVPHQANLRIIESAARGLRMPMEKFEVNLQDYGNTSTASIPLAVCDAVDRGRIKPGDHVVLVGFGAGLTWGALSLDWVEPERKVTPLVRRRRRVILFLARLRSFLRRIQRKLEGLIWGASTHRDS
jgi:3-oxoacyl-[acyl-carrier-protein] synthase-3